MDLNWHASLALRQAGASERVALAIGERLANEDLADEAGADVGSLCADGEVAHDAIGDLAHAAVKMLWAVHWIQEDPAPHDHVQTRLAADACEPLGVTPVPLIGAGLKNRTATLGGEALHLNNGGLNIVKRAVVLIEEWVMSELPHVGDGDLLIDKLLGAGGVVVGWVPPRCDDVEEVLVREGEPHLSAFDLTGNGLDFDHGG